MRANTRVLSLFLQKADRVLHSVCPDVAGQHGPNRVSEKCAIARIFDGADPVLGSGVLNDTAGQTVYSRAVQWWLDNMAVLVCPDQQF